MPYTVRLRPQAQRDLDRVPRGVKPVLQKGLEALRDNPRPPGVRKLVDADNTWRIRVGRYRILYEIHDDVRLVRVLKIVLRDERTYRS